MQTSTTVTTIENSMDGYLAILELESLKKKYCIMENESSRLHSIRPITKSDARKRGALPVVEGQQSKFREKYQFVYPTADKWLRYSFISKPEKLQILLTYFKDIKNDDLQKTINKLFEPNILPDPKNKNEGKIVPLYTASNLRQELNDTWKKQIENR